MRELVKNFLRKIFKISKQQYIEAPKEEINSIQMSKDCEFRKMMIVEDKEKERTLKLQKDFESGLIGDDDLSEEEFCLLYELYESQIEKLKQSIQKYKDRKTSKI